jgi:hypothetical protein
MLNISCILAAFGRRFPRTFFSGHSRLENRKKTASAAFERELWLGKRYRIMVLVGYGRYNGTDNCYEALKK